MSDCTCHYEEVEPCDLTMGPGAEMVAHEGCPLHGREGSEPGARASWRELDVWMEGLPFGVVGR